MNDFQEYHNSTFKDNQLKEMQNECITYFKSSCMLVVAVCYVSYNLKWKILTLGFFHAISRKKLFHILVCEVKVLRKEALLNSGAPSFH